MEADGSDGTEAETEGSDGGETETEEMASETLDRIWSRVTSEHDASSRAADAQSTIAAAREVKTARSIGISMDGTVTQGEGDGRRLIPVGRQ